MKKQLFLFSILLTFFCSFLRAEEGAFGFISYHTTNIGDDIQAIAAKRFLPDDAIGIDREFIGPFTSEFPLPTIVNGWYMHTKNMAWYRKDVAPPPISWPPSRDIDPLLISIHFTPNFVKEAFTKEGIEYLKELGPVGARDYYTLDLLQKHNIPSYFSGCLTLTLDFPPPEKRSDVIILVDLPKECIRYIKAHTNYKVILHTHDVPKFLVNDEKGRLEYAKKILLHYQKAKCVITTRLHVSLPCLALKTPVLLLGPSIHSERLDGLASLVRNGSFEDFLAGKIDFDFNDPTDNSDDYLSIRENLIQICRDWVKAKKERR